MTKFFCYGTLKRGFDAHCLLERYGAIYLSPAKTSPDYHLYKVGAFPAMVIDPYLQGGVKGEVYAVTEECLQALDIYEGAPSLFRREEVNLDGYNTAFAYLYSREFSSSNRLKDGIW